MLGAILALMMMGFDPSVLTVPIVHAEEIMSTSTMQTLAVEKAKAHGLNVKRFLKVIECESGWNAYAVGDNGLSHGLAQFYYPTRDWGIATSSAYDPNIALEIMATAWERGEAYRWSCWKNLYGTLRE